MGVAYTIGGLGTVLRASYNRIYQTPVNENLLLSNSQKSSVLVPPDVRVTLGGALVPIPPERQNVYEFGVQQSIAGKLSLNAMYYRKDITNLHDNDNFFNTGIIFPTALAAARVRGAEGRVTIPEIRRFSGSLSFTHYSVLVTPPFTGGLFLGNTALDLLSSGPFVIDHDQKLGVHGGLTYRPRRNVWTSVSMRYDSGLVTNPSDPAVVAKDPDYADLLPYVNLLLRPAARPAADPGGSGGWIREEEGRPAPVGGGLPGDQHDESHGALQLPVDIRGHPSGAAQDTGHAVAVVLVGGENEAGISGYSWRLGRVLFSGSRGRGSGQGPFSQLGPRDVSVLLRLLSWRSRHGRRPRGAGAESAARRFDHARPAERRAFSGAPGVPKCGGIGDGSGAWFTRDARLGRSFPPEERSE